MKTKTLIGMLLAMSISTLLSADISTTTGLDRNTPWIQVLNQLDNNTDVAAAFAARLAVTGVTLGTNVSTFLGTPSSANLKAALTDETGSGGAAVFATSPTITTPTLTTPVIATGMSASGSAANTFAGSTGTFLTSSGANTFKGSAMNFDAIARPTTDDGAPLGDTTHNWSDLFLATGAVLNYANGNVVVTHSSGILTMGTGELRITTAGTNAASVPTIGSTSTLTNKTLTSPVIGTGLTASGSAANTFAGSTGTFVTSTGANTLSGDTAVAANKNLTLASGTGGFDASAASGITKTTTGTTSVSGALALKTSSLSGAGALALTSVVSKVTTTGASQALTLADGVDGQIKIVVHEVDGGSAILTPTTKTGFTTITFTNVGDSCMLVFVTTRGWMIVSLNGAVAA